MSKHDGDGVHECVRFVVNRFFVLVLIDHRVALPNRRSAENLQYLSFGPETELYRQVHLTIPIRQRLTSSVKLQSWERVATEIHQRWDHPSR